MTASAQATLNSLNTLLNIVIINQVTSAVMDVIKAVTTQSASSTPTTPTTPPSPPTPATYWNELYQQMVQTYPCDTPASSTCPDVTVNNAQAQQRAAQQAMVLIFAKTLGQQGTNAQDAASFESTWSANDQQNLKQGLTNVTNTNGIPSMIKYMSTYPITGNPSAVVAVIAETNIFNSVVNYCFTE
ncbi:hypothetical protein UW163_22885 (plasmid) [Ralstonia solanacearum]|nr:hypothetical protein UW163_22885 [Ralstonia solanacearum]AMP76860.1 hypothetical protein RALBFv3_22340 [Ralstonia solanacearum]MBB6589460.1 hypothetical protein [Ralstonia solanacearum]